MAEPVAALRTVIEHLPLADQRERDVVFISHGSSTARTGDSPVSALNTIAHRAFGTPEDERVTELRDGTRVGVGDVLKITSNIYSASLYNGDRVAIKASTPSSLTLLGSKGEVTLDTDLVRNHSMLGYAVSYHAAQGQEYKNVVFVLPPRFGTPFMNREYLLKTIERTEQNFFVVCEPDYSVLCVKEAGKVSAPQLQQLFTHVENIGGFSTNKLGRVTRSPRSSGSSFSL